jgi:hypothetical protein
LLGCGGDEAAAGSEHTDGRILEWRDLVDWLGFLMEIEIIEGRVRGWEYVMGVAVSIGVSGSSSGMSRGRVPSALALSSPAKSGG